MKNELTDETTNSETKDTRAKDPCAENESDKECHERDRRHVPLNSYGKIV